MSGVSLYRHRSVLLYSLEREREREREIEREREKRKSKRQEVCV